MDEFRNKPLEGTWWLPEKPSDVFRGRLTVGDDNNGRLVLNGTEEQLAKLPTGETKPTFFGRLTADYTYDATLFDVVLRKGPSQTHPRDPSKETSAEFVTNTVLISEHVPSQEMALFNGAIVKLTGLDEWCDVTGFSGRHENATPNELASGSLTVAFRERATPRYDLGNRTTLRFLSEYAGPRRFENSKQVTLKERNTLELIFPGAISINQTVQELHIWQSFLTFGLRQASYTDEFFLLRLSSRGYDRFGLLLPGRKVPEPRRRRRRDTLFCQSTFGDRIEERLRGWRQQHDQIDLAILIVSGAAYQDSVYVHTNLLTYLQALEVLHRELYKADRFSDAATRKATLNALRDAIPKTLGASLQKELSDSIQFIGAVTLLDRLKQLLSLYPKSLTPLFRRGDDDMVMLKDVRNFLAHYGEKKALTKDFLWSRDIVVLKEKAHLFLEICLLGAMGLSDDEIQGLVSNFEPYLDWRMETSMEFINEYLRSVEEKGQTQASVEEPSTPGNSLPTD
jgi:ApeA N-terminal domain 1